MPHAIRSQMAELFNLPLARVRVIVETLGGGFGSKGSLRLEPITSFLARKANRPVKILLKREEEFVTVCKHPDDPDKNRRQKRRRAGGPSSECPF